MNAPHICDDGCVCPVHGTALIYWPTGDDHACQDIACKYGHGMTLKIPSGPFSPIRPVPGGSVLPRANTTSTPAQEAACAAGGETAPRAPATTEITTGTAVLTSLTSIRQWYRHPGSGATRDALEQS